MDWLKNNAITLAILFVSMIIAWATLNAKVDALAKKVDQYPSEDWFDLKFNTIDESIRKVGEKIDTHINNPDR